MPGAHIDMKLMQCWADVGGCDLWQGSYWEGRHQGWIGWHHPNNIRGWSWPSDDWVLIGYERWYQRPKGDAKLLEAFYATTNPSVHRPPCPAPNGYWHICYNHTG